jgi:hypothetical protein
MLRFLIAGDGLELFQKLYASLSTKNKILLGSDRRRNCQAEHQRIVHVVEF